MSTCIRQTAASHPKFAFTPTFMFGSPICPNNCGVVFLWKYILVFEKWLFSFDRSNMQIFTVNITRVVWPHVTNVLDLRYFCEHNPLFYHLNLIPCHYWSWQSNIYFLVNIFVRHTFFMSKSSIKTKTVLTTTEYRHKRSSRMSVSFWNENPLQKLINSLTRLSLGNKTKDHVDRNTGGRENSLHEVTQLG